MKEYIERDLLLDDVNHTLFGSNRDRDAFKRIIAAQPAADVVTVKHGAWLFDDGMDRYCSLCGSMALTSCFEYKQICTPYCPNCGAKMDGERKGGRDNEDR